MKKPLVIFDKVSLTLGKNQVLKDISFELHSNEILSIIGINGAGKTSLLKLIAGIHKPTSGSITKNAKRISYVPQKLYFDTTLPISVRDFLRLYNPDVSETTIKKTLNELDVNDLTNKMMGNLSGGQLQKILIVQALLHRPQILLLDEPTASIDAMGEDLFFGFLRSLHKKKKLTIVLVSHDAHTVFSHSTNVICLNKHVCCIGKPSDISKNTEFQAIFGRNLAPYKHHHDICNHHEH